MQRGRLLILVGLLLLLGTGALFFVLNRNSASQGAATPGANVPPTQVNLTKIVIAVQPLPRGIAIPAEAVTLANWPANNLFEGVITDTAQVVGKLARYDISQGQPILTTLIAPDASTLSGTGSEAALRIPKGKVAVTIPMTRLSGVAYALREGDHINVLVSLRFVDLAQATQTTLGSNEVTIFLADPTTGVLTPLKLGTEGTFSTDNPKGFLQYSQTTQSPEPRLVVQQIVQDATVLGIGTFADNKVSIAQPTPTAAPAGSGQAAPTAAPPTPVPPPDIITLIVSPQESVALKYFMDSGSGARFTLALRAAGDASRTDTESVTLQYTIENFRISIPSQLPYGLWPSLLDAKPPKLPNEPPPQIIPLPDGSFICAGANCPIRTEPPAPRELP